MKQEGAVGRFVANLYWYLRRWWGRPHVTEVQWLAHRIDALRGRVAELEAEQRRMWEQGWPMGPAQVRPFRPTLVDDN